MNLATILKDSNYKLSQFTADEIEQLEQKITLKSTKNSDNGESDSGVWSDI